MSELVATWNSVASSGLTGFHIVKAHRKMIGTPRDQFVPTPGREGAWAFAERRGNRHITVDCAIGAGSVGVAGRHALVTAVADWFDVLGPAHLIFSDQSDRYWLAYASGDPDPDEWREHSTFTLEWECSPYAYAVDITSQCVTATNPYSNSISIPGNMEALPEVTITPLDGTLTEYTFTANSYSITDGTTYVQGTAIVISSLSDTVTTGVTVDEALTGAYSPAALSMVNVVGDFPILAAGSNNYSLSWSGTATQVRVCFRYRRRYR